MYSKCRNTTLAMLVCMLLMPTAFANMEAPAGLKVFGEPYQAIPPAAADQAQVVYYRPGAQAKAPGANVYINGHFHTSLLPGGFSAFCLPPGSHMLGAYQQDAPLYRGKREELYRVQLEAGKTYFVKVADDGTGTPISVDRVEAEKGLQNARKQIHAISRAATQKCTTMAPTQSH
ncbi:DUF2846 domain-containing protein [Pseudomonas aeruginosa]